MTIQQTFYTGLQSTFSGRLYPQVAPDTVQLPYAVYAVVSQVPQSVLKGTPGLFQTRLQLDIFGVTYASVQTLKDAARAAAATTFGDAAVEVSSLDLYEDEVKLHRVSMDWSVWHN